LDEFRLTSTLAALSDPVRLSLVCHLSKVEELPWGKIDVDVCNSTLSYHLKILREAGITHVRREGKRCFVSLRQDIDEVFPGLLSQILHFATLDPTRGRLSVASDEGRSGPPQLSQIGPGTTAEP
jgi:DNA-binding transcriptional ArsR family regulator